MNVTKKYNREERDFRMYYSELLKPINDRLSQLVFVIYIKKHHIVDVICTLITKKHVQKMI